MWEEWGDAQVLQIFIRFSASPLLSPPSSGPRQPRGMLGTQAWALGQVVGWGGGGGSLLPSPSSPPWPDSRPRRRVWEVGKEGRGMRAGTVDPSLAPSSPLAASAPFPPLLPLLSRSLPRPWAPSPATPAPDLAPSCCEGEGEREGEREREREKGREGRKERDLGGREGEREREKERDRDRGERRRQRDGEKAGSEREANRKEGERRVRQGNRGRERRRGTKTGWQGEEEGERQKGKEKKEKRERTRRRGEERERTQQGEGRAEGEGGQRRAGRSVQRLEEMETR